MNKLNSLEILHNKKDNNYYAEISEAGGKYVVTFRTAYSLVSRCRHCGSIYTVTSPDRECSCPDRFAGRSFVSHEAAIKYAEGNV